MQRLCYATPRWNIFFYLQQAHSHSQAAVYELAALIIQTESDSFDLFM